MKEKKRCWFIHTWEKWSKVETEVWTKVNMRDPQDRINYDREHQKRVCKVCGKIEKHYLN
jgi:hypothetical protein